MKLSEKNRQALFAALAVIALIAIVYVLTLPPKYADKESDMNTFVNNVLPASRVSFFFDARGANITSSRKIYQCGVDMISTKLFGSKIIDTYACDDNECLGVSSDVNGSVKLSYDEVQKKIVQTPFIVISKGALGTKFFDHHAEISLDESFNSSCKLELNVN